MARRSRKPKKPTVNHLLRYHRMVDDWDAFTEIRERPMPTVIRANTTRIAPDRLQERLARQGVRIEPIDWTDIFFQVDRPIGRTLEHWLGLFYVQELVQSVPVLALDPRPGDAILDLCAAPGGKTTQIAAAMENRGLLIANEPNGRRQMGLLANVNRLGAWNVSITDYAGESFPLSTNHERSERTGFDRILVDAPCSAEGTLRKEHSMKNGATPSTIRRLAKLQQRLIERAYDLLLPGGVLVYSTCTFAPEENEAIVAHLLAEQPDARIEPIELPFVAARGLAQWDDADYPVELTGAVRIYPHHLNSGGGFVARIRRPG